jgi:hypothetical protein
MGFTSMQREPVGVGSVVGTGAVPSESAAASQSILQIPNKAEDKPGLRV